MFSLFYTGLCIFISLPVILYFFLIRHFNYWKNQSIPYVKPVPLFGSIKDVILQKEHIAKFFKKVYDENKNEPYVGVFAIDQPGLLIRDLEVLKTILVKDANNFADRMVMVDENVSPLNAKTLMAMKGQKWRHVRTSLTPTFTSGKLKKVFYMVDKCCMQLVELIDKTGTNGKPTPVKDLLSRYTADIISSFAFGIESSSLQDPKAEFSRMMLRIYKLPFLQAFANLTTCFAPWIHSTFKIKVLEPEVEDYLREAVMSSVRFREETGEKRKDLLDSLIELRDSQTLDLDRDSFVALSLSFFMGGFNSPSSTMSFALYELALHPDIQKRVRAEMKEILDKNNNEVTYEVVQEMKYLDMVLCETMRRHPSIPTVDRRCREDWSHPSGVKIRSGTPVYIPIYALHHDPLYFPNPEKFDPERFTEENKQKIPHFAYMPFGEGPRSCPGMRFALMKMKAALSHILSNFEILPCEETPIPLEVDPKAILYLPLGDVPLVFNRLSV